MTKSHGYFFLHLLSDRGKFMPPAPHRTPVETRKSLTRLIIPIETKTSYRGKTKGTGASPCPGPLMLVYWKKSSCIRRHMHISYFTIIELLIPMIILITIHINFEIKCDVKLVVCNKIACIYTDRFLMVRGYVKP